MLLSLHYSEGHEDVLPRQNILFDMHSIKNPTVVAFA